MFSKKRSFS